MAQFKVTGLDVIRDQLKERGAKVDEEEMSKAGGGAGEWEE